MNKFLNSISPLKQNKKGQTGGLITGLVFGIASLVIGVIVAFVIVDTLTNANLLTNGRITMPITNETNAFANVTGYKLNGAYSSNVVTGSYTLTSIFSKDSGIYNISVPLTNVTVSSLGIITNKTITTYSDISVSYTFNNKSTNELATNMLSGNFSEGINKVSDKIPTVLLIAAIVLILGILAVLVGVWQRMKLGGGSGL